MDSVKMDKERIAELRSFLGSVCEGSIKDCVDYYAQHVRELLDALEAALARAEEAEARIRELEAQKAPDPIAWYIGIFDGYTIKSYEKAKQIADLYGIEPRPLYDRLSSSAQAGESNAQAAAQAGGVVVPEPDAPTEFQRENRFLVLKWADIQEYALPGMLSSLRALCAAVKMGRREIGKPVHSYVVVADDWPEYELAWKAIEARVTGTAFPTSRVLGEGERVVPMDLLDRISLWFDWHRRAATEGLREEIDAIRAAKGGE